MKRFPMERGNYVDKFIGKKPGKLLSLIKGETKNALAKAILFHREDQRRKR